jgi:hypothetical protein
MMYKILDLRQDPPTQILDLVFDTEEAACKWIDENGADQAAVIYSPVKVTE